MVLFLRGFSQRFAVVRSIAFRARWSITVWLVTAAFSLVALSIVVAAVGTISSSVAAEQNVPAWLFTVAGILTLVVLICALLAPRRYTVTEDAVLVNRLGPNVLIPVRTIRDARRISKADMGVRLRVFGSGGFLGGFGVFWASRLGMFLAYVTDTKRLVLIECDGGKRYVVSPDQPDEFIDSVRQAVTRCRSQAVR